MKVRSIINLPVFYEDAAVILGRVDKVVIGDNFKIAYLVIVNDDGSKNMLLNKDFTLTEAAVLIHDQECMKSYAHGEELSVYDLKLSDKVFDSEGRELGIVSDFIISVDKKSVWGVEVSSGAIRDLLEGRQELELNKVRWASTLSAIVAKERSDDDYDKVSGLPGASGG